MADTQQQAVTVEGGEVPVFVAGPDDASQVPGVVVVPSIFGPNDDLLAQMRGLADVAFTVVMDPFWQVGGGAIPYPERQAAFARLEGFDRARCLGDVEAVAEWTKQQTNGHVVGLGICFGGPWVLLGAARGWLDGAVTWHGSRMENVLDQLDDLAAPLRLHFGDADPITPPDVIDAFQSRFGDQDDCSIVVHAGADHGFSHEGPAWDEAATAAGLADLRELAGRFA